MAKKQNAFGGADITSKEFASIVAYCWAAKCRNCLGEQVRSGEKPGNCLDCDPVQSIEIFYNIGEKNGYAVLNAGCLLPET